MAQGTKRKQHITIKEQNTSSMASW